MFSYLLALAISTSPIVKSVHPMVEGYSVRHPVIVRVTGTINEFAAEKFYQDMREAQNTGQNIIPIVISSYGGSVYSLLKMVDIIKSSKIPVATIAIGKAMSAGAVLLSCGKNGYRFVSPNTTIMIHEVGSRQAGKAEEIKASADETARLNSLLLEMISKNIGKPSNYISNMVHNKGHADWYITSEEAVKFGIANNIGIPDLIVQIGVRLILQ